MGGAVYKSIVGLSVCLALLAGCGTVKDLFDPNSQFNDRNYDLKRQLGDAMKAGRCDDGRALVKTADLPPSIKFAMTGAIYDECSHDNVSAARYMTVSARMGEIRAVDWLVAHKQPVPAADLVSRNSASEYPTLDAINAGLKSMNQALSAPSYSSPDANAQIRQPIECSSYKSGNRVTTNCN
jgi:uncharacterized protein YceK